MNLAASFAAPVIINTPGARLPLAQILMDSIHRDDEPRRR
ncbi:hypothetical protein SAMN03159406_04702 [Rhizobium sp. NFR03]|nr:hypothetical protein SAMN03159406_04702 [Rhizobium sp. NFR03]